MTKNITRYCLGIAFAFSLSACAPYKNLTTNRFEKKIKNSTIQLVDVRTPEEYTESRIPGSINIDVKNQATFPTATDSLLDKNREVAVYCKGGVRSRNAAKQLTSKGFKVYNLNKGFQHWVKKGKEIEE